LPLLPFITLSGPPFHTKVWNCYKNADIELSHAALFSLFNSLLYS